MKYCNSNYTYEYDSLEFDPSKNWGIRFVKKNGGSLFTSFSVSSKEYRKKYPTEAQISYCIKDNYFDIYLISDWGELHTFQIDSKVILDKLLDQFSTDRLNTALKVQNEKA
jgi:hypothetical protein